MRKFLNKLCVSKLLAIASFLGKSTTSKDEAVNHICEQAKGYRWSINDLRTRFELFE